MKRVFLPAAVSAALLLVVPARAAAPAEVSLKVPWSAEPVTFHVLLPPGYETSGRAYPVVYWLSCDSCPPDLAWFPPSGLGIEELAAAVRDEDQAILVAPEAVSALRGVDAAAQEAFLSRTLIPYVSANYRSLTGSEDRALLFRSADGPFRTAVTATGPSAEVAFDEGDEPMGCGGFGDIDCPEGYRCVDDPRDSCDPNHDGQDCPGICVRDCEPIPCRVGVPTVSCPLGQICVDDPTDTCDRIPGADCPGFCVGLGAGTCDDIACGGVGNLSCPPGYVCVDDPGDACNPLRSGVDCPGVCSGIIPVP
jgi:hypothetical protein